MQLTITVDQSETILNLDIPESLTLVDFAAYVAEETALDAQNLALVYQGKIMDPAIQGDQPLSFWGLTEGDLINVMIKSNSDNNNTASSSSSSSNAIEKVHADIERVRLQLQTDTVLRRGVQQQHPDLLALIDDPIQFREKLIAIEKQRISLDQAKRQELKVLEDDPYNEQSQKKILEMIHQEAIMDNLNRALEHNPEVFGRVTMLYIETEVNGQKVKAFVDSGAQATIISPDCVDRCNMTHLIDTRFRGVAHGVGTANILGRIHSAPIKVGDSHLPCGFTVMENSSVDLLFGLDMLKRHQACIDLEINALRISNEIVPFLSEADIPDNGLEKKMTEMVEDINHVSEEDSGLSGPSSKRTVIGSSSQLLADAQPTPSAPNTLANDEIMTNLMSLGFSKQECADALTQAGGNPELAAAILFQ